MPCALMHVCVFGAPEILYYIRSNISTICVHKYNEIMCNMFLWPRKSFAFMFTADAQNSVCVCVLCW